MPIAKAAEKIATAMQALPGVTPSPHRFGGTEYRLDRREIGHIHGDSLVDIPFTKKIREELGSRGKSGTSPHPARQRMGQRISARAR